MLTKIIGTALVIIVFGGIFMAVTVARNRYVGDENGMGCDGNCEMCSLQNLEELTCDDHKK